MRDFGESHGRLLLSDENRRMDRGGRESELEDWLGHGVSHLDDADRFCSFPPPTDGLVPSTGSFSRGPQRACTVQYMGTCPPP